MKFSTLILVAPLLASGALAFVPSNSPRPQSTSATALQAEKKHNAVGVGAAACVAGLGLSAQAAFAAVDAPFEQQRPMDYYSTASIVSSTSTVVAEIDQFSLPSYDSSKGSTLIDLNGELENVNKQTMSKAKARREYVDTSLEKQEADALRRAEKDGGSLLDSLVGQADVEKKAMVEAEIAESRANRWKTF